MSIETAAPCASRQEFVALCKRDNVAFLDANRKRVRIEYVRQPIVNNMSPMGPIVLDLDSKGKPIGVLVAYKRDNGILSLGWSAAKPAAYDEEGYQTRQGERFDKSIGLWKAIRRATGEGRLSSRIPDRILAGNTVTNFLARASTELEAKY